WADEDRGVAVELPDLLAAQHLRDPDHVGAIAPSVVDARLDLGRQLGSVRLPGRQDDPDLRIEEADGADEMDDPLLAGDAPDEEDVWRPRLHPLSLEGVEARAGGEEGGA